MESNPDASGSGEGPSSSPAAASTAGATSSSSQSQPPDPPSPPPPPPPPPVGTAAAPSPQPQQQPLSRYESQKRRDWNTFLQYLRNHKPPLSLSRCSGAHVIEFLKYLDQFGKTKVHVAGCAYFGHPNPPASCACPLRQAWGSLDALIGRLRAAYEENGGRPESNPFGARAVGIYLREVRTSQAKARGIPYEKKKRKRPAGAAAAAGTSSQAGAISVGDPTPPPVHTDAPAPGAPTDTSTAGTKQPADGSGSATAGKPTASAHPGGSSTS